MYTLYNSLYTPHIAPNKLGNQSQKELEIIF